MTISSWLNFGRLAPRGKGSAVGRNFLAVFASPQSAFFIWQCPPRSRAISRFFLFRRPRDRERSCGRTTVDDDGGGDSDSDVDDDVWKCA